MRKPEQGWWSLKPQLLGRRRQEDGSSLEFQRKKKEETGKNTPCLTDGGTIYRGRLSCTGGSCWCECPSGRAAATPGHVYVLSVRLPGASPGRPVCLLPVFSLASFCMAVSFPLPGGHSPAWWEWLPEGPRPLSSPGAEVRKWAAWQQAGMKDRQDSVSVGLPGAHYEGAPLTLVTWPPWPASLVTSCALPEIGVKDHGCPLRGPLSICFRYCSSRTRAFVSLAAAGDPQPAPGSHHHSCSCAGPGRRGAYR